MRCSLIKINLVEELFLKSYSFAFLQDEKGIDTHKSTYFVPIHKCNNSSSVGFKSPFTTNCD